MAEVSEETGKLIASEMNDKCPAMVYAMTKKVGDIPAGSKIKSCKIVTVRRKECEISYVTCRGDACSMPKKVVYPFDPPLPDKLSVLVLQSQICAPEWDWLVKKPFARLILVVCTTLTILVNGLGFDGIVAYLEKAPRLEQGVATIFGSAQNFAFAILGAWLFALFAHFIEAMMAYRYCELTLRFLDRDAFMWGFQVFLVGWPVFKELRELVEVQEMHSKQK